MPEGFRKNNQELNIASRVLSLYLQTPCNETVVNILSDLPVLSLNMALKDTIILWNDAVNLYLEEEFEEAIKKFKQIENPNARIFYNIAFSYLQLNRLEDALKVS